MASLQSNFERQSFNISPRRISEGQWVGKPFEGGVGTVPHRRGEESEA